MRTLMLAALFALGFSTPALAGKNAGGAMIVHTNDAFSYTANICNLWAGQEPADCESAGTRTDRDETTPALIWFVAAFYAEASPAVTVLYFGTDHNLPDGSYFANYGLCGPAGSLDVPDAGWPATGGNSVAFGTAVAGDHFFPFYYFNVYGFAGAYVGSGINPTGGYAAFVDDGNPPALDLCNRFGRVRWHGEGSNDCPAPPDPPTGACCLASGACVIRTAGACADQGGAYIGDDIVCAPNLCPILSGACCFADGHCELFTATNCSLFQGFWQGPATPCDPNPCPQPSQACCFADATCIVTTAADCLAQGGTPQGPGTACEEIACRAPALGACCLSDGSCAVLSEEECTTQGGIYLPDVPCAPEDPCFAPAVQESSWGQIKSRFR